MQHKRFLFLGVLLVLVLAVASPAFAAPQDPLAPLVGVDSPDAIAGQYIVVFKDGAGFEAADEALMDALSASDSGKGVERGAAVSPEARQAALARAGINVQFRYTDALNGFAATLPPQAVAGLRRNPNVAYIEADSVITIDDTQSPATWGIDRIDQRSLPLSTTYTYNYTGAGVTAYIIDTGILITHNEFGGRASVGKDTVGDGKNGIDCNGHGTHVAGTVGGSTYGVAKGVTLKAVRVLNCSGSGTTSGVIAGVDWVTADHAVGQLAVANMSLGGSASTSLDTAVKNSISDSVTYAIAAGNNNKDACRYSPARVPAAITVGATTNTDARASYSNYGSCLDIFAPGSSITSSWIGSNTATNTISGTSMATPHVCGAAALYLQANSGATPQAVRDALVNGATPNVVTNAGRGSPNKLLYTLF
jgi:aqualysin 1